jgi:hypothetical protein
MPTSRATLLTLLLGLDPIVGSVNWGGPDIEYDNLELLAGSSQHEYGGHAFTRRCPVKLAVGALSLWRGLAEAPTAS